MKSGSGLLASSADSADSADIAVIADTTDTANIGTPGLSEIERERRGGKESRS
jgi:hypothetical protein